MLRVSLIVLLLGGCASVPEDGIIFDGNCIIAPVGMVQPGVMQARVICEKAE